MTLTFDSQRTFDSKGNACGMPLSGKTKTHDGKWVDSTGAFFVGELERLDQTLNMPLIDIKWSRDIDTREDVSIADDASSYTLSTFFSNGGLGAGQSVGNGKSWAGKSATQIAGVSLDISKIANPLTLWANELSYTIPEIEAAAKIGRPIDQQKFEAMSRKHEMDTDEQVYIGDTGFGYTGLLNNSRMSTVTNVPAGASGFTQWSTKNPDEILADFNYALTTVWAASAWAVIPTDILIPPAQYGYISTAKVATASGLMSIKRYIEENNLLTADGKGKLSIRSTKWAVGAGVGGTITVLGTVDRMLVYTKDKRFVRFPQTMLQRTPVEYRGLYHLTTYYCKLGVVEMPYPETAGAFDGI